MKLSELKINPDNPQIFDDLSKLENSIRDFPKMLKLRKIVYDPKTMMVLGGNKRLICLQNLKYKEISDDWVISAEDLTEDEKHRFIIQDNILEGDWDWDILANDWNQDELIEWGLDLPLFDDFSDKNKEINTELFEDEMIIKLKYTEDDYILVREQLSKIAETPEQAVWKLLNNE